MIEIPVVNANSVDPDQMLHSVVSALGLHCLPITLLGVYQLKWVRSASSQVEGCLRWEPIADVSWRNKKNINIFIEIKHHYPEMFRCCMGSFCEI